MEFETERYTAGIGNKNRRRLEQLHRGSRGTVTVQEAARLLGMDRTAAARLLAHWCAQGWARRVRRGLYVLVPLGAAGRVGVVGDPWVLIARALAPCYIGGWSACEYWHFTEQIFRTVVVFTAKPVRPREGEIAGHRYIARVVTPDRMFGTRPVWRDQTPVDVSDPSRTIVDIPDEPALGGGMRHVSEVVLAYFRSEHRNDGELAGYVGRLGNHAVFKRLGFLLERLSIDAPDLVTQCLAGRRAGYVRLDPGGLPRGRLLRRWGLRLNVEIPAAA